MDDTNQISRRAFGQVVGAAAAAGTFQVLAAGPDTGQSGPSSPPSRGGSDELCEMSAVDLGRAHPPQGRFGERGDERAPCPHRARQPEGERDRDARRRPCPGRRRTRRRAAGQGRGPRRAPWSAGRAQGSRRHRGHPDDPRVAVLPGLRADARRAHRVADPRRRRDHARQDQHAGVRRGLADVQRGVRRHPQSLRHDAGPAAEAAAVPRSRSRAGWCRSPMAATRAARFATPPRSATSSAFVPRRAACRAKAAAGLRSRSRDRWRELSPTSRSS